MKVSFRNEGKIKTFSDKRELKEINSQLNCSIRNAKGSFFQAEGKCYQKGNRSSNMKEAGFIESKKCLMLSGKEFSVLHILHGKSNTQSGE